MTAITYLPFLVSSCISLLPEVNVLIICLQPCVPIVLHRRPRESIQAIGINESVEWRPDSSMLVVIVSSISSSMCICVRSVFCIVPLICQTSGGYTLLYRLGVRPDQKGLYEQMDSPTPSLRRDSAELFLQESIPPLLLTVVNIGPLPLPLDILFTPARDDL